MPDSTAPVLEMRKINKQFPGVIALRDVDFDLHRGEVHVLMGANGAGKSTLMKVLSGVYPKDSGDIFIDGKKVEINGSKDAQELGVAIIYQNFSQVPHLSVAENIFLGREKTSFGLIDYRQLYRDAEQALSHVGLDVDVKGKVIDLSVSQRQMVEIAKALSFDSKILVMDEPTSALTKKETETLFDIINALKKRGIGIVYISHRIEELRDLGTRVTVMRDGGVVGTRPIAGTEMSDLVKMMVGKDVKYNVRKNEIDEAEVAGRAEVLKVEKLHSGSRLKNISFTLRRGEVLGLFGLMGSGRTELVRALFGVDKFDSGTIFVDGSPVDIANPGVAVQHGFGFLTEDRLNSGLAMTMGVGHNITLPSLDKFARGKVYIDTSRERRSVAGIVDELKIKTPSQSQFVQFLSGGNQQKVVFGKWIMAGSRILFLDEPTQGIDVEAKDEVHKFILDYAHEKNNSVLFISSELPEIISICDRILVISDGQLVSEIQAKDATQEALMGAALGSQTV